MSNPTNTTPAVALELKAEGFIPTAPKEYDRPISSVRTIPADWYQLPEGWAVSWDWDNLPCYYIRDEIKTLNNVEAYAYIDPAPDENHREKFYVDVDIVDGTLEEIEGATQELMKWVQIQRARREGQK